jgi:hypothetical protein
VGFGCQGECEISYSQAPFTGCNFFSRQIEH